MNVTTDYVAGKGTLTLYPRDYSNIALLLNEIERLKNKSNDSLEEEINNEIREESLEICENSEWECIQKRPDSYKFLFDVGAISDYNSTEELEDDMMSMMFPNGEDDCDYDY